MGNIVQYPAFSHRPPPFPPKKITINFKKEILYALFPLDIFYLFNCLRYVREKYLSKNGIEITKDTICPHEII